MHDRPPSISRREFLRGRQVPAADEGWCISGAVVAVLPAREQEVAASLAAIEGVEVRASQNGKMVLVLEGVSSGAVGALLARIAIMDGVIAANMAFEHTEASGQVGA